MAAWFRSEKGQRTGHSKTLCGAEWSSLEMSTQTGKRRRFGQIFMPHLRKSKGVWVCGPLHSGVAAAELLKPWPLKMILDHGSWDKPLPISGFLQGVVPAASHAGRGMHRRHRVDRVCAAVLYSQIFITSSSVTKWSMRCAGAVRHLQRLSLSSTINARSGDLMTKNRRTPTTEGHFAESILKFLRKP